MISAVANNAKIHQTKARLLEEVPKLQRLAVMTVKGLSGEEFAACNDLDQGLVVIAEDLDSLINTDHGMDEELDRHLLLMDEIDTKVDRATSDLMSTNVRLKDAVNQPLRGWFRILRLLAVLYYISFYESDGRFDNEYLEIDESISSGIGQTIPLMDEIDAKVDLSYVVLICIGIALLTFNFGCGSRETCSAILKFFISGEEKNLKREGLEDNVED
ncbi:hypothetical protein ACH5RR_024815 [Cinchona calisaya]|uniref:t-SNARE coiled-coil homology domain-containing protein n=1 Tax=Cinchona calisaya TaxID=153742 RepID=A0ABD2YXV6_9GENT